jgi:hypothetical protein
MRYGSFLSENGEIREIRRENRKEKWSQNWKNKEENGNKFTLFGNIKLSHEWDEIYLNDRLVKIIA